MIKRNKLCLIFVGGGLGNQMFQYAVARSLAIKSKKQLIMVKKQFADDKDGRSYALSDFVLNDDVIVANRLQESIIWFFFRARKNLMKISKRWDSQKYIDLFENGIYMLAQSYTYIPFVISKKKTDYIWGVFQSERYFLDDLDLIRHELKVKTPPNDKNQKMLETINERNSVCLHIRRGDYINNKKYSSILNICTKEYYMRAIKYMEQELESPTFFVFSNDSNEIEWIKKHFVLPDKSIYIDFDNPVYEELRLMYNCKHFILSNSSFSWWAQELCEYPKSIVVAPDKWINNYDYPVDIYKSNWHMIDVR